MLKKLLLVLPVIEAAVMALMLTAGKDDLIINLGIRGYHSLLFAWGGVILVTVIAAAAGIYTSNKKEKQKQMAAAAVMHEEAGDEAGLFAGGKLDNEELRKALQENALGGWSALSTEIDKCIRQLHDIDSEQERLHVLLKHNAAKVLSDTEGILDQAEQYMCQNVRKIINYMNVYHEDSSGDQALLRAQLAKCCDDNEKILNEVHEFLLALTDYLNGQGDKKYDNTMLESYKKTLLAFTEKKEGKEREKEYV